MSSGIGSSDLSVPLNSVSGLPTEGVGVIFTKDTNGDVVAGSVEIIHWTGIGGSSLTLTNTGDRGLTGSDSGAQAYSAGAYFEVWVTSYYYASQRAGFVAEHSSAGVHDTTKVITHTATQTMTNKTLTAPIITNPTIQTYDGWQLVSDSWSYASVTTITVPTGAASLYQIGDKIKLTQTTAKYFIVTAVADTLLTVTGGSDYSVANAAITSPYYSHSDYPLGWPSYFNYACTGPTGATITARFTTYGRTVDVVIRGAVTGAMNWTNMPTLPIACSASAASLDSDAAAHGVGGYLDSGTLNKMDGLSPSVGPSDTTVRVVSNANSSIVTATNPITWANTDTWYLHFCYEF